MTIEYKDMIIKIDNEKELDRLDYILKSIRASKKISMKNEGLVKLFFKTKKSDYEHRKYDFIRTVDFRTNKDYIQAAKSVKFCDKIREKAIAQRHFNCM